MSLASLFNIPESKEELLVWSFNHMGHHRDINRRLYEVFLAAVPEYELDPMNPAELEVWARQHQAMHNTQNAILGIAGNDLVDVDWQNPAELADWIQLNGSEHYQAGNILGV